MQADGLYSYQVEGNSVSQGKGREPVIALASIFRGLDASNTNDDGRFRIKQLTRTIFQSPFKSPSVFNVYLPNHQPDGALSDNDLVAPEFQIYTPIVLNSMANYISRTLENREIERSTNGVITFERETRLANRMPALLSRLNLLFHYGTLDTDLLNQASAELERITENEKRAELAASLLLNSPDFSVME